MWIEMVASVALACACGKSRAACKDEALDLQRVLNEADHSLSVMPFDRDLHLVARPELPPLPVEIAPVVRVKTTAIVFHGEVMSLEALRGRLQVAFAELPERVAQGRPPGQLRDPHRLILMVDEAATWDRVAGVFDAAREANLDRVVVAFDQPMAAKPPPRSSVDDELDKLEASADGGTKATEFARIASTIVKSCPALIRSFGAVGGTEGGDTAQVLIDGLAPALVDCNCDVDMPALRSTMWRLLVNRHPLTALAIALSRDGTPIELPATTPWREASKRFTPSTKSVAASVDR